MASLKGPVPLVLGAAVLVYVVFSMTGSNTTTKSSSSTGRTGKGQATKTTEVRFSPYVSRGHNAFMPLVLQERLAGGDGVGFSPDGGASQWNLTGISTVNGVQTAVLENSSSKEVVFLRQGEVWNGHRLMSVDGTSVLFHTKEGRPIRVNFAEPADVKPAAVTAVQPLPTAGGQQFGGGIMSMPGMMGTTPTPGASVSVPGVSSPESTGGRRSRSERGARQ